ncbi:MAG: T9SS type A sorting domain-containing protein [Bacteroidetes bacterium]|nr:T9SS type A sorting domain-containing protein [Bacteroidota bacterium]
MSDLAGNLLFYSNGFSICNDNNDTMLNGAGIDSSYVLTQWYNDGQPAAQTMLVIPQPGNETRYYNIFHVTIDTTWNNGVIAFENALKLRHTIIDMTLDSGRGAVIQRELPLMYDTLSAGQVQGVKHANGRDWWVLIPRYAGGVFYSFLVTPDTLIGPINQQLGPNLIGASFRHVIFSPDGNKYAFVDHRNHLLIYDFDRCSGVMSNAIQIPVLDSMIPRGVVFSPNSRYLYMSSNLFLYQFDTWATNVAASQITVAEWDSFYSPQPPFATTFYLPMLASDDKIYINTSNGTDRMHIINFPDSGGLACNVCQHCLVLPTFNSFTMPNYPNYFLGAETGSLCDTLTSVNDNIDLAISLTIKPNPAQDYFWMDYNLHSNQHAILNIYNILGEKIIHRTLYSYFNTVKVECASLPSGMYIATVIQNNKLVGSAKFIKE